MTDTNSITQWIEGVRQDDSVAVQMLWNAYFEQLVRLARQQMDGARKGVVDEEDVALSAFNSFCQAARKGRFTQLVGRESLWPLLVSITAHKSVDAIRAENRKKRGGTGGPISIAGSESERGAPYAARRVELNSAVEFLDRGPTPEAAAELKDLFQWFMVQLDNTGDLLLRRIALMKLEGASTTEIAKALGVARRTIERKQKLIHHLLKERSDSELQEPATDGR